MAGEEAGAVEDVGGERSAAVSSEEEGGVRARATGVAASSTYSASQKGISHTDHLSSITGTHLDSRPSRWKSSGASSENMVVRAFCLARTPSTACFACRA